MGGKEPMDATSFAFSTADCEKMEASKESEEEPEKASCDGLDCAGCLAVPDYGCGFADGTCYEAGKEPMDATSFAFSTAEASKEEPESPEEESPEEEELPECSCGIGAVEGDEKFQAGSADGDKMCEFGGANCATFFEGCDAKGATVCSLKIEYVEEESKEEPEPMACTRELMQCPDGSMVGRDSMNNCEFTPCPEVESEESEESEEEALCSEDDCIRPCKGRRKPMCQVKKGSKCSDKKARGKGRRTKYFSKLACASTSQTFMYEPAQTAWTTEDIAIYGFAAVGLVALARGALIFGKQLRGGQYQAVEFDSEL